MKYHTRYLNEKSAVFKCYLTIIFAAYRAGHVTNCVFSNFLLSIMLSMPQDFTKQIELIYYIIILLLDIFFKMSRVLILMLRGALHKGDRPITVQNSDIK